jgi:hypothetical protein
MMLEFFYGASIAQVKVNRGTDAATDAAEGATATAATTATNASIAGGRFGVAIPASCPLHLRNLMVACLSSEPGLRPNFDQVGCRRCIQASPFKG